MAFDEPRRRGVNIMEFGEKLRESMPGVRLHQDFAHGGVRAVLHLESFAAPENYASDESALEYLAVIGEHLREHAINELGLRARLRANEIEVEQYRESNLKLQAEVERLRAERRRLKDQIDALLHPEDDDADR